MDEIAYAIDPAVDRPSLTRRFRDHGHVAIPGFLADDDAERLLSSLAASPEWIRVINGGTKIFEIRKSDYDALDKAERDRIEQAVNISARDGFQFRYDTIRVSDSEAERREMPGAQYSQGLGLFRRTVARLSHKVTGVSGRRRFAATAEA